MSYNLTGIATNGTGIVEFTQGVNDVLMFGWLGTLILIGIVAVIFMAFMFRTNDTGKSLAASAFIAFGLAIMLRALGLLPNLALFITLIVSGLAIAFTWNRN